MFFVISLLIVSEPFLWRGCSITVYKYSAVQGTARRRAVPIALFFLFFFGVAQAFKKRLCSCICYFSVFLHPIMLRFGTSDMLQRGDHDR